MSVHLKAFRPSAEKVYHIDVHPTQSWLVTSDLREKVVLWDWKQRQVLYELNARGVDERQLVDTKLQKIAEGESDTRGRPLGVESIRGGGVKDIKFYDDDVRYWGAWLARSAAQEAPSVTNALSAALGPIPAPPPALKGKRFLVIVCDNKVIFLDLITMKSRDVPKAALDGKTPVCVEFLQEVAGGGEGPFAAFGGSDGAIRLMSMASWLPAKKYIGGHKGYVNCLLTFLAPDGETILVSGGADGALVMWSTVNAGNTATREASPKLTISKAHGDGVYNIALLRVHGAAPQLVTCGGDKTVAIWDTHQCKELRRMKPIPKMICNTVATWRHPGAPFLDILTCVKDPHLWVIDKLGLAMQLVDLSKLVPPTPQLAAGKKLKFYCMAVHSLQPHLVMMGSNVGVFLCEIDSKSLPSAAPLPAAAGEREQTAVYANQRGLHKLSFYVAVKEPLSGREEGAQQRNNQLAGPRGRADSADANAPLVRQWRNPLTGVLHDSHATISVSKSGRYVAAVWEKAAYFSVHRATDWGPIDSGTASSVCWDVCADRYAIISGTALPARLQAGATSQSSHFMLGKSSRSKARAAAAEQEAAAAQAASLSIAFASASVDVKEITPFGTCQVVKKGLSDRTEMVTGLQGGALLGVAYKMAKRNIAFSSAAASASAVAIAQTGGTLAALAPGAEADLAGRFGGEVAANFILYSWDTLKAVSPLLPEPEWSAWDPIVEHCALAYKTYVVIAVLRPAFRSLGSVAIQGATGGVWHRRQLFLATPTSIECVFVDAGVSEVDIKRQQRKIEELKKAAEAKAVAENGELAVLDLEPPKPATTQEKVQLRPPMLQVVRLASFQALTAVPSVSGMAKPRTEAENAIAPLLDGLEARAPEVAVAGGGVSVAQTRLPPEQRRPAGPLIVIGVQDGVLWLVDRYYTAHAITLSHPGIRCRCLAAYGDPVSAVKWASRLGREHHDDLAQFLVGMGYAREALHLPGISKRYEFDLAMQVGEIQRALQCLLVLSGVRSGGAEDASDESAPDTTGVLALAASQATKMESAAGVARYAKEYLGLIDKADATGHSEIAQQALRQLANAGAIEGVLTHQDLRMLTLRLATHGDAYRLQVQSAAMVRAAQGREAALAAALLGDADQLERAWQDTGMLPEAALHAQSHGRPTLAALLKMWNRTLEKQQAATSAATAKAALPVQFSSEFQAGDEEAPAAPTLQKLAPKGHQPIFEVVPPGNFSASAADGNSIPGANGQLAGVPGGVGWGAGVQGLKAPLDLSVLEGLGKGPAPQKGPAKIAVPVNLAELEKQAKDEQERRRAAELQRKKEEEAAAAEAARKAAEAEAEARAEAARLAEKEEAALPKGPSVEDFDRAFFESLNRRF